MSKIWSFLLYTALLTVINLPHVWAIFDDQVNNIDWQKSNIGRYKCVFPASNDSSNDHFLILSMIGDDSLLSWVDKTSGELVDRLPLNFHATDAMLTEDNIVVLQTADNAYKAFDSVDGFEVHKTNFVFEPNCIPDMSLIQVRDGKMKILDEAKQFVISIQELPQAFNRVEYFNSSEDGNYELMISTNDGLYNFSKFENHILAETWVRDESLTNIIASTFISAKDPTISKIYAEVSQEDSMTILEAYKFRVNQTLLRLKEYLMAHKFSVGNIVKNLFEEDDEATILQKDVNFGLLKFLIVATDRGTIANLDIRTGKKIWSIETGLTDIITIQAVMMDTEIEVYCKSGTSLILEVSAIQREPFLLQRTQGPSLLKAEPLENGYIYLETDDPGILMSRTDIPADKEFYFLNHNKTYLGASVFKNNSIEKTWGLQMGDEQILSFAFREQDLSVSLGNILGDRSVLYKYLYPHLAAYVTGKDVGGAFTLRIVDTVTGELVYSVAHDDGIDLRVPINLVFGENWVIYTYFSTKPVPEQKIGVIELYESLAPNERYSTSAVEVDAFSNELKPKVLQNAYLYPEVIKNMALTKTKFGITIRSVVLELENGQITYLPKFILSARRVAESQMSASDKKEFMMSPYVSAIPISDYTILTHHRRILSGPNSLLTSVATNLESTSLVCSLGHDLYCSRVYPSSQFDQLKPSFQKFQLLSTIAGLLLICFFIRPIVDTKKLKTQWLVKH
ncbi:LADA_0H00914g1_1 [Lachancea dasiensis]|uniref:ER membrane protein complex subunit 1 n=1 Tax=Lachancea dasiensis TaxID=1072105 RepID=A0A1G4JZ09_9SACH|nr:LADA_0H00914g1_1 [Lachancea dasiensis]